MRKLFLIGCVLIIVSCSSPNKASDIDQASNTLEYAAPKPPLGWNSYDAYHGGITEAQFLEATDSLTKKLLPFGYDHAVVDFCWFNPGPDDWDPNQWKTFVINQEWIGDSIFSPILAMDEYGRLLPATNRFPSAQGGSGFKAIADYVHSKGMKFGIHIIRGIPRQAVALNTPIKGTNYHAADVIEYSPSSWTNTMHKVDVRKPGAQEYYNSIFDLYAEWGVDYVKADDVMKPLYHPGEVEMMRKAIDQCGRPMVLSLSWGDPSMAYADHIAENAELWRISGDFWDRWEDVVKMFDHTSNWTPYRKNGKWPDADMLPIGKLCLTDYPGNSKHKEHLTYFSHDEIITMMNLWCMARSPLMWGGDPISTPEKYYQYLTNKTLLDINQNSVNNMEVYSRSNKKVWVAEDADSSDKYVAFFNLDNNNGLELEFDFYWMKWEGTYTYTNIWTNELEGTTNEIIKTKVKPHASVVYKLQLKN